MRPGNHVDRDTPPHAPRRFSAGIDGSADGGDVTAEGDGYQAAADLVLLDELDVGGFERCIARLDGGHDAFTFDQSDCFTVCHKTISCGLFLVQNFDCLSCHDQFFVGWNDPNLSARAFRADFCFAAARVVLFKVEFDAGPVQIAANVFANGDAVL